MRYLLDSDWVIDALGGISLAVEAILRYAPAGIGVSIVTYGEVFHGAFAFANPQDHLESFRRFLSGFTVLGLSDPIMELFARNRYLLQRQGNITPDLDLLIAATALHYDLTLLTRKLRHFDRVPDLKSYQPS